MNVNEKHLNTLLEFYTGHGKLSNSVDTDITNIYACCYCPCYLRYCSVPIDLQSNERKNLYENLSCKDRILKLLQED